MIVEDSVSASIASRAERLTRRQLLFWLGQKRHPDIPLYNMVIELELGGELDVTRFRRAFAELLRASDALRSVFEEIDGIARRRVLPPSDVFELPLFDVSVGPEPELEYRERTLAASAHIFDLGRRCFDARLFKVAHGRFVFWFCQHHIIGDGASIGLIYRFLAARYADQNAVTLGSSSEAGAQEAAYLRSDRATEDERFWAPRRKRLLTRARFYGAPKEEPARHVERVAVELDRRTSDRVRELARSHGVPALRDLGISAWFQTVLFGYLQRVTGRSEQAIGIPFRNRHTPRAKTAVGCFIEVLPIQLEVESSETFAALFRRVHEEMVAVLGRGQACVANSDSSPLFDVSFNFLTEKFPPFSGLSTKVTFTTGLHGFGPMSLEPVRFFPGGESLSVHCQDYLDTGCFTLWFDFHSAYFDAEQRAGAVTHFLNLLRACLDDPLARIADVELVGARERARLVEELNPPWSDEDADASVVSWFAEQARRAPERAAVRFQERALRYGELAGQAHSIACVLKAHGIGRDALVAVLLDRSLEIPSVLLGTLMAGGAYVPLDPTHPAARNALVLEDANPALVVTTRRLLKTVNLPPGARALFVEDLLTAGGGHEELPVPEPAALAYVLFTSGSSGRPKGVAIPHSALANFLRSMRDEPGLVATDRVLAVTTIAFDIAALELFLPLVVGATVELVDAATAADPVSLARTLEHRRPSVFQATPATFRMLLEVGWAGDPELRVLCGGEALSPELAAKLAPRVRELWNMYGPTETTVWSSLERVNRDAPAPITIGQPIRNTSIYVLNEAHELAPVGVPGEICIGGAGVARGYYGNDALTESRFIVDPFSSRRGARLYKTGDLGLRRRDGRLECLGRADFQVKIRGYRIELGEIETVLSAYPGVVSTVVVAREDRGSDKQLAAYVVARGGSTFDVRGLRRFVQDRLPVYMVPATFTLLDALPLTPNGKIDRKALPKPELAPASVEEPPSSDLELRVAAMFEQLLGVAAIGRNDDFFELGGHSLLAAELLVKLNAIAKRPLGIGQIFQKATIAALSELVQEGGTSDEALVIPLNRVTSGTPLFCVCGIHLYRELALNLPANPVYGVYLPAEEAGLALARTQGKIFSVEELAQGYLEAIRKERPKGPYCLAGVSFGGVLAYEIAQALTRQGEDVALLALFDSALPRALRRRWIRWVTAHTSAAMKSRSADYLVSRLKRAIRERGPRRSRPSLSDVPPDMEFRVRTYLEATRRYDAVIRPYRGRVLLFRASARDDFAGYDVDESLGWGDLVQSLSVHEALGTHLGIMLEPGVRTIVEPMREALRAIDGERTTEIPANALLRADEV